MNDISDKEFIRGCELDQRYNNLYMVNVCGFHIQQLYYSKRSFLIGVWMI